MERSSYPYTPSTTRPPRPSRASSVFPYSTARPPTSYSQASWLPSSRPRPDHSHFRTSNPFHGHGEEVLDRRETPLYARSDYAPSEVEEPTGTNWSRSSFEGGATARLGGGGGGGALQGIDEEKEEEEEEEGAYGGWKSESPVGMTPRAPAPPRQVNGGVGREEGEGGRRSSQTWPSILSLGQLVQRTGEQPPAPDPFADPFPGDGQPARRRQYSAEPTPGWVGGREVMTPGQHQRLGRMSVAPPPRASLSLEDKSFSETEPQTWLEKVCSSRSGIFYRTWRPVITAGMSLAAAALLASSLNVEGGGMTGSWLEVAEGVFDVSQSEGGTGVKLGLSGWCAGGEKPTCVAYEDGAFANKGATLTIPGDSLLEPLANLAYALTALLFLLAAFQTATASLHFYLHFALNVPYAHLPRATTTATQQEKADGHEWPRGRDRGDEPEDPVQAEADLRARCDRIPFEGYVWVWWAWWAHRRGPVGHVFASAAGVGGLITFGLGLAWEKQVKDATGSVDGVHLGNGGYLPVVAVLLILDPLISSLRYWLHAPTNIQTFLEPPSPTPLPLYPPPSPLQHHPRQSTRSSFFAPPPPTTTTAALFPSPETAALDPETRRWLEAYPLDADLVPLLAALRTGEESDDFLLSDVGLLYLRQDPDPALLVPPAGDIRHEILDDAHLEGSAGGGHHLDVAEMKRTLGQTFWWMGMEEDVRAWVAGCAECERRRFEERDGMTEVPFTGVTGWETELAGAKTGRTGRTDDEGWKPAESALAAEMAFQMRKAEEEAERY